MNDIRKEYNSLDVLKFILAVFVLIIHSEIDKTIISPLLRVAVPTFFIISSYLFFSKIEKMSDKTAQNKALLHLMGRNISLYLFWTVLQLPISIYGKHYHIDFWKTGIYNTLRDILLGKGFTGSWYIITLIVGVPIIYFLSKKISEGWLLCLTLPLYLLCCLTTNYEGLFEAESLLVKFSTAYEDVTQNAFNTSLPGGLFWISMGNYLAKRKTLTKKHTVYFLFGLSAALIAAERYLIIKLNSQYLDDCYFSLVLLCPIIFVFAMQINKRFKSKFRFRELSTLIYVTHGTCGRIVGFVLKATSVSILHSETVKVCITLFVAVMLSCLFIYLREHSRIKLLKYGY